MIPGFDIALPPRTVNGRAPINRWWRSPGKQQAWFSLQAVNSVEIAIRTLRGAAASVQHQRVGVAGGVGAVDGASSMFEMRFLCSRCGAQYSS